MTPDSSVQTPQEGRSGATMALRIAPGTAVCLRAPRSQKLRVVRMGPDAYQLMREGWTEAPGVYLSPAALCRCGCGLPIPWPAAKVGDPIDPEQRPLQQYADPEGCRKAVYALMHPTLDLSGMLPEKAKQAARMAEEAVRAAKLGQSRATVDARSEVEHVAASPDGRPSCRLRVTPRHFELLAEIKALGYHAGRSFSAIVMELIEREAENCRLRAKQEGEHDV